MDITEALANPPEPQGCRKFCEHLAAAEQYQKILRYYPDGESRYCLVCRECITHHEETGALPNLVSVSSEQFCYVDLELGCDGIVGAPPFPSTETSLRFQSESYPCRFELIAVHGHRGRWLGLSRNGDIIDLRRQEVLCRLKTGELDLEKQTDVSSLGEYVVAVNTHGQFGGAYSLRTGRCIVKLDRGTYHIEHSKFPVSLVEVKDQPLLIHATDWNQLHITNLRNAKPINNRAVGKRLDYFHAGLSVSPNNEWMVSNGWHWHPLGEVRTWNLVRWLEEEPFEPEDGTSIRELVSRAYYWDGPLCWVNDYILAVWGWGDDDLAMSSAVLFFDVRTGERVGWFPGPEIKGGGFLAFETYLFSVSPVEGTSIWDISTGTRLHHDPSHRPVAWSQGEFLSAEPGAVVFSRLEGKL